MSRSIYQLIPILVLLSATSCQSVDSRQADEMCPLGNHKSLRELSGNVQEMTTSLYALAPGTLDRKLSTRLLTRFNQDGFVTTEESYVNLSENLGEDMGLMLRLTYDNVADTMFVLVEYFNPRDGSQTGSFEDRQERLPRALHVDTNSAGGIGRPLIQYSSDCRVDSVVVADLPGNNVTRIVYENDRLSAKYSFARLLDGTKSVDSVRYNYLQEDHQGNWITREELISGGTRAVNVQERLITYYP